MADFYFSVALDDERTLCLAPLTDRHISASNEEIDDPSGYFLFEKRSAGDLVSIEIIAHIITEDAALRLREMLHLS